MKQTTVKAKKKSSASHKTDQVSIHPAENGFTVRHHKKAPERKKGSMNQMYTPPPDPEETVHEDRDSMLNRIGQIFPGAGGAAGAPDGGGAPAAGGDADDQAQ